MNKVLSRISILTLLLVSVCTFAYGFPRSFRIEDKVFKNGDLQIIPQKVQILQMWSGLVVEFLLTNNGKEVALFDINEVELYNHDTKETFYSISKNKNMVTLPYTIENRDVLLNPVEIDAGKTIRGWLLVMPGDQIKKLKNFDIVYRDQKIKVTAK